MNTKQLGEQEKPLHFTYVKHSYTWVCYLFGGKETEIVWHTNIAPCAFWRWMQFLFFGNRWRKIKESK